MVQRTEVKIFHTVSSSPPLPHLFTASFLIQFRSSVAMDARNDVIGHTKEQMMQDDTSD
jgi:hypothetical protein